MKTDPEKIHQSIAILHLRQFVLFLIILVVIVLFENGFGLASRFEGLSNVVFLKEEVLLAISCLVVFVILNYLLQLQWSNSYFMIFDDEVIFYSGIIEKKEKAFNLSDVDSVDMDQGIMGRLFNYGSIKIVKSKILTNEYLPNIPNPEKYLKILSEKVEKNRSK